MCVSEREILDDNKIPWLCDIQRSERESKRVCMCVSEWEFKGECVCESVCVWERERVKQGETEMPWLCDIQIDQERMTKREFVWKRAREGVREKVT